MANNILTDDKQISPFDSIRRFSSAGVEFWSARELMGVLGYKTWQNFERAIQNAIASCQNSGHDKSKHFSITTKKSKGRDFQDFDLSRQACYLVAMNGDPLKLEIAQAQSYFVAKTREAEVLIPAISEKLEIARLENESLKIQLEIQSRQDTRIALHGIPTTLLLEGKSDSVVEIDRPTLEVIDQRNNTSYKGQTLAQIKDFLLKKHGVKIKSGADIKRLLEAKKLSGYIAQTPRSVLQEYIPEEFCEDVISAVLGASRQMLIGE